MDSSIVTHNDFLQWCLDWHQNRPTRPLIMGILNVTPDSFSDGGRFCTQTDALRQARILLEAGADILDIGGESTRPGAKSVSTEEELKRVIPLITALRETSQAMISIDTIKPEVMREAVAAGAGMVNDVNALRTPGALESVAELGVFVCLMHMQATPQTMQDGPDYPEGIMQALDKFFKERYHACRQAGIAPENMIFDPGFGFGKCLRHNLRLLHQINRLSTHATPIMLGVSRKSSLGAVTGADVSDRMAAGLAVAVDAVAKGVAIIRTHDVAPTKQALQMITAINTINEEL